MEFVDEKLGQQFNAFKKKSKVGRYCMTREALYTSMWILKSFSLSLPFSFYTKVYVSSSVRPKPRYNEDSSL